MGWLGGERQSTLGASLSLTVGEALLEHTCCNTHLSRCLSPVLPPSPAAPLPLWVESQSHTPANLCPSPPSLACACHHQPEEIDALFKAVTEKWGTVDVLVSGVSGLREAVPGWWGHAGVSSGFLLESALQVL